VRLVKVRRDIDLEDMVSWAFSAQQVDIVTGRKLYPEEQVVDDAYGFHDLGRSGDGCAALARVGELGCVVDGGRTAGVYSDAHPDAEVLYDLVRSLKDFRHRILLRTYGRRRSRPEWEFGLPMPVPLLREGPGRRHIVRSVGTYTYRGTTYDIPWCPITYHPSPEWVEACRGEYRCWHEGLRRLEAKIRQGAYEFRDHRVTGVSAPREPWKLR